MFYQYTPARAIQLWMKNVVHHASSVTNFKAAWFDTANSSWANDCNLLLISHLDKLASLIFRNTFRNDGNSFELQQNQKND